MVKCMYTIAQVIPLHEMLVIHLYVLVIYAGTVKFSCIIWITQHTMYVQCRGMSSYNNCMHRQSNRGATKAKASTLIQKGA